MTSENKMSAESPVDRNNSANGVKGSVVDTERFKKRLAQRYRAEQRFRLYGLMSIGFGLLCLVLLFTDIIGKGHSAFFETRVSLDIHFDAEYLQITDVSSEQQLNNANFDGLIKRTWRAQFPEVKSRSDKRLLATISSSGSGYFIRDQLALNPHWLGTQQTLWLLVDDDVDVYYKSRQKGNAYMGRVNEKLASWIESLISEERMQLNFNTTFFTAGDSREPEQAGIRGAMVGSLWTLLITLILSFPIGVAAAIYLEEYAPQNRWTDLIEVNINNLAAVPSIIFGLLGLAIFINFFELPRSVPLVGGLVLTLMTLPTIIISSRAAIKAVPPSIREAALGIGASKMQVVLHHVLPLAMPGMLTGTIIGMAQALGETAPLLMIGMVAFIVDVPGSVTDPAAVLPVQIFLWADSPERAFVEKTSAAIMVLLAFLIVMNTLAVLLRKRLERRW